MLMGHARDERWIIIKKNRQEIGLRDERKEVCVVTFYQH